MAEGTPNDLIEEYEKPALEDVFLHLCMQDGDLETTRVREQRKSRQPIIKGKQILADIYRKYSMSLLLRACIDTKKSCQALQW